MKDKTFKGLDLFYEIYDSINDLVDENETLKEENKYLKDRVDWLEKSLSENYLHAKDSMSEVLKACLDGRIKIEDDKTIIKRK